MSYSLPLRPEGPTLNSQVRSGVDQAHRRTSAEDIAIWHTGRLTGLVFCAVEWLRRVKGLSLFGQGQQKKKRWGAGAAVSQKLPLLSPSPATALGLLPSRALSSGPASGIVRTGVRKSTIVGLQFFDQLQVLLDQVATVLERESDLLRGHA